MRSAVAKLCPVTAGAKGGASVSIGVSPQRATSAELRSRLHEVIPGLSRVAVLAYAMNPGSAEYVRQAEAAALALGIQAARRDRSQPQRL